MGSRKYRIIPARATDLGRLAAIELAAARLLEGYAPPAVLEQTTSEVELQEAQKAGTLWVALSDDEPVGFAHVLITQDGNAHLEELDVHPMHGRQGLGTRLVKAVCEWAAATGTGFVTLTTFRDVSFNMPFYAGLGFDIVPSDDLSATLRAIVADETRRGIDPATRVVMRYRCKPQNPVT